MSDLFKAFERFLFRDVSFLLGGTVVLASIMYVYGRLPSADLPMFKYLIAAGVAYAVGYSIQEFFTMIRLVRTKAGHSPNRLGRLLYWLFERRGVDAFDSKDYEKAKFWLFQQAPQRYRDDHERTESLKQVGTGAGPSFIVAGGILLAKTGFGGQSFQSAVATGFVVLGFGLWLLGWLKVTQQAQYLVRNFRRAQESSDPALASQNKTNVPPAA